HVLGAHSHVVWSFFFSSRRRHTRFSRDWSSDVCSSDLGLADKRIGVEENSWFLTVTDYRELQKGLPGATFQDASGTVEQLRLVRSEERRVGKECRCEWAPYR